MLRHSAAMECVLARQIALRADQDGGNRSRLRRDPACPSAQRGRNRPGALPHHRQSHRAGPALFSTIRFGQREAIKLQAAYLGGRTYGRIGNMFTMRAFYEF